jgi:hypothetical protein
MRQLYLALDRPDIQFVAKEISRAMSSPTVNAYEAAKSCARYLLSCPRVVWRYPRQPMCTAVHGLTDSNWAGCPITRKSTTATHLMVGRHPVYAGCSTQTIISLSSGEAEFYGAVKTACRLLGMAALMKDVGWEAAAILATDSAAAKGMASRRGAARVRHIHCPALWLQQAVTRRVLSIVKRPGKDLSPDVGTKVGIPPAHVWELLGHFGVVRAGGKSTAQLAVAFSRAHATTEA